MTGIDLHPGPDTPLHLMPAADLDMALVSIFTPHGIGPNPDEAFELVGLPAPTEVAQYLHTYAASSITVAECQQARRDALDAFFAAIQVTTVQQLAERLGSPVPLTANLRQVQAYQDRYGCRRVQPDGTGPWCEEHGSYYDHEEWTSRGCAHAARDADFALHIATLA